MELKLYGLEHHFLKFKVYRMINLLTNQIASLYGKQKKTITHPINKNENCFLFILAVKKKRSSCCFMI